MNGAAGKISHVATLTAQAQRVAPGRVAFIDLLRFVAAFQMVQGHTIAALLAPEHRHGVVHALWSAARGLTSVAFLFAAGFAFYVMSSRDYEKRHRDPKQLARRTRRAVQLIALGYLLHLPVALWTSHDASAHAAAWRSFWAVDVLQCIGVSLLAMQALCWWMPTRASFGIACACIGAALLALTPWGANVAVDGALTPVLGYVSQRAGSLFPLTPWACHIFLGVACAAWLERASTVSTALRLSAAGVALLLIAWCMQHAGVYLQPADQLGRLGKVLLASAALAQLAERAGRVPLVVQALASETLIIYVFHLLLVYGHGLGLADQLGAKLSPQAALSVAAAVVAASFALALIYRQRQARRLAQAPVAG